MTERQSTAASRDPAPLEKGICACICVSVRCHSLPSVPVCITVALRWWRLATVMITSVMLAPSTTSIAAQPMSAATARTGGGRASPISPRIHSVLHAWRTVGASQRLSSITSSRTAATCGSSGMCCTTGNRSANTATISRLRARTVVSAIAPLRNALSRGSRDTTIPPQRTCRSAPLAECATLIHSSPRHGRGRGTVKSLYTPRSGPRGYPYFHVVETCVRGV